MVEFGTSPSFDAKGYHLSIIEKQNGRFVVYADVDGLRYFQDRILDASHSRGGDDHGVVDVNGDRQFKVGAAKLTVIRLFIDAPPRVSPPHTPPMAYRMPGKVLEMAIRFADAEQLFEALGRMADKISNGQTVGRIALTYGLSIAYLANWTS